MAASATSAPPASPARASPPRAFGRYELRQLLGKSAGSMSWLAFDPRLGQEVMLTLPRAQPGDAAALELRLREMRQAARLNHPNLAHVIEAGVQDHWPYLAVDRALGLTLAEWLARQQPSPAPLEVAGLLCQALQGLAFAHEAGIVHRDLQMHHVLVGAQGQLRLAGFGAVEPAQAAAGDDDDALRVRRDAERDVLAAGVLLHQMLAGAPVLDEPDIAAVIARLAPRGRDLVRLPWTTPQPVPEGLRAIANRCTASQERQRYLNARTLLRALEGWREVEERGQGDPIALLIDRLSTVGHLPALPGIARRVARLSATDTQRTDEMAELLLQDVALAFELLRLANSAQVRGTQMAGGGAVLTLRRAITLLGVDGVRGAANGLRQWPGPMNEAAAAAMARLVNVARLAGHAAQALRPPGYDAEVVFLVALMQNLGRLLVQYHFPDEAEQIRQLMQPLPAAQPDERGQPGLSEAAASYAVLGVDIESLGAAVARHWGLGDEVQHMIRRIAADRPVHQPDDDADMLRAAASAANEAVDAMTRLPSAQIGAAVQQVAQRYARVLELSPREVQEALQGARAALQSGTAAAAMPRAAAPQGQQG
ncbi:HDOD domain-containing protein [Piscinibacter sp.]|uniref:HDOD domain-containing protein n=1 Tax=Piscinibacter sp. TaxID=1903157 RepID=UPI0039E673FA